MFIGLQDEVHIAWLTASRNCCCVDSTDRQTGRQTDRQTDRQAHLLMVLPVIIISLMGRSQLSTFMKAYTAYARGEGVWDHRMLFPRKSTFIFNHGQCIIKYCTCLECGQYAHICRSFMYNNTFEALFLTSKCTKRGFLWTQTVAPHRGFCKAAQRRYRIFSTWSAAWSLIINKCIFS